MTVDLYWDSPSTWYSPEGMPVSRQWCTDYLTGDEYVALHPEKFSPAVVERVMSSFAPTPEGKP